MVDGRSRRSRALDWLLGADRCSQCNAVAQDAALCAACLHALPWNDPACPTCALPLPAQDCACPRCRAHAPLWASACCALRFGAPLDGWMHALKYRGELAQARRLGSLLALAVHHSGAVTPELLLPMPLHPRAQRRRGYNQAFEIARELARRLQLPVVMDGAHRLRDTGDQTRLTAAERRRNMRGAFRAVPQQVAGRYVAIVDDVLTTGASCEALTRALLAAGAARVEVWCAARTPLPQGQREATIAAAEA